MEIKYRAVNRSGEIKDGIYSKNDLIKLKEYLLKEDLYLIDYKVIRSRNKKIDLRELHEWTLNLYRLSSSGIDLISSLKLIENNYSKDFNKSIQNIILNIEVGDSFSESIKKEGGMYPNILAYLVKVGEESGNLDKILYELSTIFKYQYELKEEIKSAIIYPLILLIVSLIILLLMVTYIIPSFLNVFDVGENLPMITKFILKSGEFIKANYLFISLINLGLILRISKLFKENKISEYWHKVFLDISLVGDIYLNFTFANYFNSLGILLNSGENIINAMDNSNNLIGNKHLRSLIYKSRIELENGLSLSDSLSNIGYLRKEIISILKVGEESGNIAIAVLNCGDLYKTDGRRKLDRYIGLVEPVLLIFMSLIIGIIIISVISPIFEVINIM